MAINGRGQGFEGNGSLNRLPQSNPAGLHAHGTSGMRRGIPISARFAGQAPSQTAPFAHPQLPATTSIWSDTTAASSAQSIPKRPNVVVTRLPERASAPAPTSASGRASVHVANGAERLVAAKHRWILRYDQLAATPSIRRGWSDRREWEQRRFACGLVCNLCRRLFGSRRKPERVRDVKCTAMLYLQRFYVVHPFQDHSCELVACAAVQLAAKAEEVAVKTPLVVEALLSLLPGVFASSITTAAPQKRSECLIRGVIEKEHILLLTLSFDVAVHLPFRWVTRTVHSLTQKHPAWMHGSLSRVTDSSARVTAAALSLLIDSFFTECCITMSPKEMAVCAVALAAKIVTGAKMPLLFLEQHATSALCGNFAKIMMTTAVQAATHHTSGPVAAEAAHASTSSAAASSEEDTTVRNSETVAAVSADSCIGDDPSKSVGEADLLPPPLDIFG